MSPFSPAAIQAFLAACALTATTTPAPSVQHPDFFTGYAAQSGQTHVTRPPWAVAGVDAPVGAPATFWLDPATATLPAGCSYSATGSSKGTPLVTCDHAVSPTFAAFDFSGTLVGTHGAVLLKFTGNVTGKVTLYDNYFGLDAASAGAQYGVVYFVWGGVAPDLVMVDNTLDLHGDTLTNAGNMNAVSTGQNASYTAVGNAFLHTPGRIESGGVVGDVLFSSNYVEGFIFPSAAGTHGEILYNGPTGVVGHVQYSYNTVLQPKTVYAGGGEAPFYVSNGGVGPLTVSHVEIDHNTEVINLAGGKVTTANALAAFSYNTFPDVSVASNYVDHTGAYFVMSCTNVAVAMSGNVDLVSGAPIDAAVVKPSCAPP